MLLADIHGPIVLGIIGGLLGSFFINVNTTMSALRKKYMTTTMKKTIETGMFGLLTMIVCVLFIAFGDIGDCQTPKTYDNQSSFEGDETIDIHNL